MLVNSSKAGTLLSGVANKGAVASGVCCALINVVAVLACGGAEAAIGSITVGSMLLMKLVSDLRRSSILCASLFVVW